MTQDRLINNKPVVVCVVGCGFAVVSWGDFKVDTPDELDVMFLSWRWRRLALLLLSCDTWCKVVCFGREGLTALLYAWLLLMGSLTRSTVGKEVGVCLVRSTRPVLAGDDFATEEFVVAGEAPDITGFRDRSIRIGESEEPYCCCSSRGNVRCCCCLWYEASFSLSSSDKWTILAATECRLIWGDDGCANILGWFGCAFLDIGERSETKEESGGSVL